MANSLNKANAGQFVDFKNERYYRIENIDEIPNFFMSMVSSSDHWLFISSNTGLTAGRVSSEFALFPYEAVDKVEDSLDHTGNKTIIKLSKTDEQAQLMTWEPFSPLVADKSEINRHLYKHQLGNKICFEEVHSVLNLTFRFTWAVSDEFGVVVESELINHSDDDLSIEILDGLQNILPAGAPLEVQTNASNLVDAYRFSEKDEDTNLAIFSLYSGITDKPEPVEVLTANCVFQQGLEHPTTLLCSRQVNAFKQGYNITPENNIRGIRSAYMVHSAFNLQANQQKSWQFVANLNQSQNAISGLIARLNDNPEKLQQDIQKNISEGCESLQNLIARADGHQKTASEMGDTHHYANVLFNAMRGGVFNKHYEIDTLDFANDIEHFNQPLFEKHRQFFESLAPEISLFQLQTEIKHLNDSQLDRLLSEYLPITFGRRHGDPSRPWNKFAIKIKDHHGNPLLSYEGNWRDIFQNWEALLLSYPEFIENVIAKFVNASTIDGYNPYRITKKGIDWEIEDPKDPWSYIGYWGDHQIIYLLKLLEQSQKYHPKKLSDLLGKTMFSYANVPYRIQPFENMLVDPKNTIQYDEDEEERIKRRVKDIGADGKLVLDASNQVYQVNLLEKLLVPLLAKLSNFVVRGGIWLNTQRPEWNDANNALVGQGLSMVTLYYMRRYVAFFKTLLAQTPQNIDCSNEVVLWLESTASHLTEACKNLASQGTFSDAYRYELLCKLGQSASDYRLKVYQNKGFLGKQTLNSNTLNTLLDDAIILLDDSIQHNQTDSKLYHAYNILTLNDKTASVDYLYGMLEGQVSVLSSGTLQTSETIELLNNLFASDLYRDDQKTFMLYPDEKPTPFLQKNALSISRIENDIEITRLINIETQKVLLKDEHQGCYRFHPALAHLDSLEKALKNLKTDLDTHFNSTFNAIVSLYKTTFNHKEFTGRSHGMFGFEGLGCIYWHMVSKLLLATQESYFRALDKHDSPEQITQLGELYYKVRQGIGFNKTPSEYGAFPYDPYSHTPKHSGAQQPGMTGQVKEEVLSRFGELGVQANQGTIRFAPSLLRKKEFLDDAFEYAILRLDNRRENLSVGKNSLAFSLCQTPVIYTLTHQPSQLKVDWKNGDNDVSNLLQLSETQSNALFERTGELSKIEVLINEAEILF